MDVTKRNVNHAAQADVGQNELHDWIDAEVPQMIDDEINNQQPEIIFDKQQLKKIEEEVTKLLKQYFK